MFTNTAHGIWELFTNIYQYWHQNDKYYRKLCRHKFAPALLVQFVARHKVLQRLKFSFSVVATNWRILVSTNTIVLIIFLFIMNQTEFCLGHGTKCCNDWSFHLVSKKLAREFFFVARQQMPFSLTKIYILYTFYVTKTSIFPSGYCNDWSFHFVSENRARETFFLLWGK